MTLTDKNGITKSVEPGTKFSIPSMSNEVVTITSIEDLKVFVHSSEYSTLEGLFKSKQNLMNNFANGSYFWC